MYMLHLPFLWGTRVVVVVEALSDSLVLDLLQNEGECVALHVAIALSEGMWSFVQDSAKCNHCLLGTVLPEDGPYCTKLACGPM